MTRHTELACDRLFGKQQELEIYGKKTGVRNLWNIMHVFHNDWSFEINY